MNEDLNDLDPDEQQAPERAFRAEYSYKGKTLKPFSFVRETAAYELGWKLPKLSDDDWDERPNPKFGEEGESEIIRTYPGMLRDCALIVWLCLQPDSVCAKARRKPEQFDAQIDQWAEKEGISMTSESGVEVANIYGEILSDYLSSRSKPKLDDDNNEDPN